MERYSMNVESNYTSIEKIENLHTPNVHLDYDEDKHHLANFSVLYEEERSNKVYTIFLLQFI